MSFKEKLKNGLVVATLGGIIASMPIGLGGIIYTVCRADSALTDDAKEMRKLEDETELRQKYPQLNEAYEELRANPEVIKSIDKYEQEMSKMIYWFGVGMCPAAIAGGYVILAGSRRRRE